MRLIKYFSIILLISAGVFTAPADDGKVDWLESNLLKNADFEQADANGKISDWQVNTSGKASVSMDRQQYLSGKSSLCLSCEDSPSSASISSQLIPVTAGKMYLISTVFRQQGFNLRKDGKNEYAGVNSYTSIEWLDGKKRLLNRRAMGFPYGSSPWDMRDVLETAPAKAEFVRISVAINNNSLKQKGKNIPSTLWLDGFQFRQCNKLPTPEWAKGKTELVVDGVENQSPLLSFFVASEDSFHSRGGKWSKIKTDLQAERGGALVAPAGVGKGMMAHSPYFSALPPGLYRLRARLKTTDNTPGKQLGWIDINSQLCSSRLSFPVMSGDFKKNGEYQDFKKDFILRGIGYWCLRMYTQGGASWSIDSIKIFPLQEFEDNKLVSIFPASVSEVDKKLQPRKKTPYRIMIVAGVGYERFRLNQAFHLLDGREDIKPVWVEKNRAVKFKGFPEKAEELFDYSLVVLCNANIKGLNLLKKNMLKEYVQRGGILLMLGGHQSYERGSLKGSMLEDIVPVKVSSDFSGLKKFPHGEILVKGKLPWPVEADFSVKPRVYFLHQVTPLPDAEVFVKTQNGSPFMVGGKYGKGRVICVLGMPYGSPEKGQIPFWQWKGWTYLLRNSILWASGKDLNEKRLF
jgi:uncharacterized membrane protein